MPFQRLSFEDALAKGQLTAEREGARLTSAQLDSMKVSDLEQNVALTLLSAPVRLLRKDYGCSAYITIKEEGSITRIRQHPQGVGYYWNGVSTEAPIFPRSPCLPESNALEFLREMYAGILMGLNGE